MASDLVVINAREAADAFLKLEKALDKIVAGINGVNLADTITAIQEGCDTEERARAFGHIRSHVIRHYEDYRFRPQQ